MPKKDKLLLAIYIEEYVPTKIPIIIAKAKYLTAEPPNINKDTKTNSVVKDVMMVLDNV